MAILKTIFCDICAAQATEPAPNSGWKGWGALHGIVLDGADNPSLCPDCLTATGNFIDARKNGLG